MTGYVILQYLGNRFLSLASSKLSEVSPPFEGGLPRSERGGGRWLIGYLINIMYLVLSLINHPGHPPYVGWPPILQKEGRLINIQSLTLPLLGEVTDFAVHKMKSPATSKIYNINHLLVQARDFCS